MGDLQRSAFIEALADAVVQAQHKAVWLVHNCIDDQFVFVVESLSQCTGHVLVTGVGKAGLAAQRFAATLCASGTPALFIHPVEAMHGDVGVVGPEDCLVVFSRSGNSDELQGLVLYMRRRKLVVMGITTQRDSWLGQHATITLSMGEVEEADPLGLLATTSVTVMGILGDALALAVQRIDWTAEDFAAIHPGGSLGRRLTLRVSEVMVTGDDVGTISPTDSLLMALELVGQKRGTLIVETSGLYLGVITAGDIARYITTWPSSWRSTEVTAADTTEGITASPRELVSEAIVRMQTEGVMALPVIDHGVLVGLLHLHDALRAGVQ